MQCVSYLLTLFVPGTQSSRAIIEEKFFLSETVGTRNQILPKFHNFFYLVLCDAHTIDLNPNKNKTKIYNKKHNNKTK